MNDSTNMWRVEFQFLPCQSEAKHKHEQIISNATFCRLPRLVKRKMATLDDKLLGEKLHYYCSSSEDFFATDVESFLIEHGLIQSKDDIPKIIRGPTLGTNESDED